jgi:hypothetical protein
MLHPLFFLFAGDDPYFPEGGMGDYVGSFPSIADAEAAFDNGPGRWAHIATVHRGRLKIVESWHGGPHEHWVLHE